MAKMARVLGSGTGTEFVIVQVPTFVPVPAEAPRIISPIVPMALHVSRVKSKV